MDVFLIHRFSTRRAALRLLKDLAKQHGIALRPVVLNSSDDSAWRSKAEAAIKAAEAVVVYDEATCSESANAVWEIEKAAEIGKPVVILDPEGLDDTQLRMLCGVYHDDKEFNSYFQVGGPDTEFLYKLMVQSSEELVQRRQRMNAFFITAMGVLLALAGAIAKFGSISSPTVTIVVMATFGVVGLLLCNSWRNLIDNYGKLNAAKFRVILKLEESLSARVFAAEWAALGKGRRPEKYQSFTRTENKVPLWFAGLIVGLVFLAATWHVWVA